MPGSSPPRGACGCHMATRVVTVPEGDVLARAAIRLTSALAGGTLIRAELRWPAVAAADLTGQQVSEVSSYGKHLFIRTRQGWSLHTHLRMDGTWHVRR